MKACQFHGDPRSSAGAWLPTSLRIFVVACNLDRTDHLLYDTLMQGPILETRRPSSGRSISFYAVCKQRAFVLRTKPTYRWQAFLRSVTPNKLCMAFPKVSTPITQVRNARTCLKNVARTTASVRCRRPGTDAQKESRAGEASTRPGMEHAE